MYSICIFGKVVKNTYIPYSYSVSSLNLNEFCICIGYNLFWIWSYLYHLVNKQHKPLIHKHKCKLFEIYFIGEGVIKSLHYTYSMYYSTRFLERIYLIFVFCQVQRNKYIGYSYLVRLLERNLHNIHIWLAV